MPGIPAGEDDRAILARAKIRAGGLPTCRGRDVDRARSHPMPRVTWPRWRSAAGGRPGFPRCRASTPVRAECARCCVFSKNAIDANWSASGHVVMPPPRERAGPQGRERIPVTGSVSAPAARASITRLGSVKTYCLGWVGMLHADPVFTQVPATPAPAGARNPGEQRHQTDSPKLHQRLNPPEARSYRRPRES